MRLRSVNRSPSRTARVASSTDVAAVSFDTEIGWTAVAFADRALTGIVFGHASQRQAQESLRRSLNDGSDQGEPVDFLDKDQLPNWVADIVGRLQAYAAGDVVDFGDIPVDERHLTDFGRQIVRACRRIPRGESRSYGELAAVGGSPGAARAVGQVMARNRYPLVVPCHRVLASGGRIGGFSSPQGLAMKRRLLALEQSGG